MQIGQHVRYTGEEPWGFAGCGKNGKIIAVDNWQYQVEFCSDANDPVQATHSVWLNPCAIALTE